ncbi:MAG: DUF4249 family protein [Bacteroidales bacterium]|nr:DUF4249 family protein [Bacteroidales bacterium]
MKFSSIGFLIIVLSVLTFSCVERINIELDDSYTRLIVDGAITTDTAAHTVMLSSTTSYYYNQVIPPVTGALLTLTDGTVEYSMNEDAQVFTVQTPLSMAFRGKPIL